MENGMDSSSIGQLKLVCHFANPFQNLERPEKLE
jgi:hypothetical protein